MTLLVCSIARLRRHPAALEPRTSTHPFRVRVGARLGVVVRSRCVEKLMYNDYGLLKTLYLAVCNFQLNSGSLAGTCDPVALVGES